MNFPFIIYQFPYFMHIFHIVFSIYNILLSRNIFHFHISKLTIYIHTYIFPSRYKIFPFNIVSLRMYTYISHWTRNLLIFISRNSSSWIFLSEGQGSFSFFFFFDSIQIFPTFKLAPLSDITDEWRKGKKGRGMKRGMSEKKEKWRCRPGPANGLISKAPQRGILGPGRWWNSRSTGVSEDIFAWTGWLGENLRELLCCYEFLWLWMRQGHRNGISQLSILNLHRFKSSVVSAGGSFLQRFLFPFLI